MNIKIQYLCKFCEQDVTYPELFCSDECGKLFARFSIDLDQEQRYKVITLEELEEDQI